MIKTSTNPIFEIVTETLSRLVSPLIDLWILHDGTWHHAIDALRQDWDAGFLEAGLILPESLPSATITEQETIMDEISPGIFLIGTSLAILPSAESSIGTKVIVWGTVRTSPREMLTSLLRIAQENELLRKERDEYREGMSPHLEQISYNFEELTYFRRLGQQIELRDVTDPLTDLAERILTDLCSLINSESLGFIITDRSDSDASQLSFGKSVTWIGRQILDETRCAEFLATISRSAHPSDTFVQNQMQSDERYRDFPEIHSCIRVPVTHRGIQFGWLVALNRIPWHVRSSLPVEDVPLGVSDNEFGTGEASLMHSAATTLAAHYRNSELFREKELLLVGIVRALINAIDAKDSYTCGHSDRVAVFAKCIGEQMGLDSKQCEHLYMSGLLHDLGKIGIPDHVLCKPGKLTDEEFAIIRQHPEIGHSILNHLPQLQHILPGVLHHHESVDGGGYPAGLSEDQIPLFARILAVADSYDAMTSARPYRSAMPIDKAVHILNDGSGTQWDREVVNAFLQALPNIEAACEHSDAHLKSLLRTSEKTEGNSQYLDSDTIARAVTAIQR